jgi:hypothetical protein
MKLACYSFYYLVVFGLLFGCRLEKPEEPEQGFVPCLDQPINLARRPAELNRLWADGRCIRTGDGQPVRLRGFSIADPQHITRKRGGLLPMDVINKAIESYGANAIRIPVIPDDEEVANGTGAGSGMGFFHDPQKYLTNYLDPAVQAVVERGAYAIVEPHFIEDYLVEKERVLEFWTHVAPRYADHPRVIFELMNEPIGPSDWRIFRDEFATPVIRHIRQYAPESLLIVGGPEYSVMVGPAADLPVEDPNVVYGAHVYPETGKQRWLEPLTRLARVRPLMITEWGYALDSEKPVRGTTEEFGEPFVAWMNQHELSWAAWIFDNQWGRIMFDGSWQLRGGETHMGELVRRELAKPPFGAGQLN